MDAVLVGGEWRRQMDAVLVEDERSRMDFSKLPIQLVQAINKLPIQGDTLSQNMA